MKTIALSWLVAAPCLAAAPQWTDIDTTANAHTVGGAEASLAGDYGNTIAGDWDRDLVQDIAFTTGTNLVCVFAPGQFDLTQASSVTAVDMASLPTNAEGTEHCIFLVNSAGLSVANWDAGVWTETLIAAGSWTQVESIRTHVGDYGMVIVGLTADKRTLQVITARHTYQRASTIWTEVGSKTVATNILDFELLDWDTLPGADIAFSTGSTLEVHPLPFGKNALYVANMPGYTAPQIERIQRSWYIRDLLAVITKDTVGNQFLSVHRPAGIHTVTDLSASEDVIDMTAAEFDGPAIDLNGTVGRANSDMFLTLAGTHYLGMLLASDQISPRYSFSTLLREGQIYPCATRFGIGAPVNGSQAPPVIVDLDNDGGMDLCLPIRSESRVWIYKDQQTENHYRWIPNMHIEAGRGIELHGDATLELELSVPEIFEKSGTPADELELSIWTLPDFNVDPLINHSNGTLRYLPLTGSDIEHLVQLDLSLQVTLNNLGSHSNGFDDIVFFSVRQVKRTAFGIGFASPPNQIAFHAYGEREGIHEEYIENFPGVGVGDFEVVSPDPTIETPDGDGSGHCVPCIPFDETSYNGSLGS